MEQLRRDPNRMWFIVHAAGLGSVAVLLLGGLIGQRCPERNIVGASLKTGPFAYGDGATTEAVSLVLIVLYVAGTLAMIVVIGRLPNDRPLRSLMNVPIVMVALFATLRLGASQSQSAVLCDGTRVTSYLALFVGLMAGIGFLNRNAT